MDSLLSPTGIVLSTFAFLIGGIPFGVIISKTIWKMDPRDGGSGGIGFTNVMRVVGKKAAFMTLVFDTLKGTLPVMLTKFELPELFWVSFVGIMAVFGHTFSVYLRFKGGKGIATGFGVLLGISPLVAIITFFVWNGVYFVWKYSSLAGLVSFTLLPLAFLFTGQKQFIPFSFVLMLMIYYKHTANIKRLISGTEKRMSPKPKS